MPYPIRPNVSRMVPYPPGRPIEEIQREMGLTDVVKLASNENPLGPSPLAVEAMKRAAESTNLYPDARGWAVKEAISARFGVPADQVMLGNGSDEIIGVLGQMFLEPGTELVMGDPSFMRYDAAAGINAATLVKVPLTSDWRHDLAAMARAVNERTRLVFIANPNNPTGTVVTRLEFDGFLASLPEGVLVVLDEAYFEFAHYGREGDSSIDTPDGLDYVKARKPVVALRTFSKAYGLAGIRVGYGFADAEIVRAFNAARPPFDVNSLAQAAAIAALRDHGHLERTLQENSKGMRNLASEMEALGLKMLWSHANFACIDLKRPDGPVVEALLRHGVIVRPGKQLGMPGHVRVSIGTPAEMDRFCLALGKALKEEAVAR